MCIVLHCNVIQLSSGASVMHWMQCMIACILGIISHWLREHIDKSHCTTTNSNDLNLESSWTNSGLAIKTLSSLSIPKQRFRSKLLTKAINSVWHSNHFPPDMSEARAEKPTRDLRSARRQKTISGLEKWNLWLLIWKWLKNEPVNQAQDRNLDCDVSSLRSSSSKNVLWYYHNVPTYPNTFCVLVEHVITCH